MGFLVIIYVSIFRQAGMPPYIYPIQRMYPPACFPVSVIGKDRQVSDKDMSSRRVLSIS